MRILPKKIKTYLLWKQCPLQKTEKKNIEKLTSKNYEFFVLMALAESEPNSQWIFHLPNIYELVKVSIFLEIMDNRVPACVKILV